MRPHDSRRAHNALAEPAVDRRSERRGDADWLARRLADPSSQLTAVWRERSLVFDAHTGDRGPVPGTVATVEAAGLVDGAEDVVFLGEAEGVAYFSVDLSEREDPLVGPLRGAGRFVELRQVGAAMSGRGANLLAYARAMATWHRRHRFCGQCGAATESRNAGHLRVCTACGIEHFPRTDPAVIMLVHTVAGDGGSCLLGRQASWPPGMFSALAGFVEPGESLESAVAREVREETGIAVETVRYHSSQPWPFPTSIMLGFYATSPGGDVRVDTEELEQAVWATRSELEYALRAREVRLPPPFSIARRLIDNWLRAEA
ncbi:MAG: NAD(+) diphosphatase [Holophagales bacterium]|nr:NAD(+) diphosphatase [Holophagales bacterium]MYF05600.1 NAD(+) diphosphatase [Holophagales bacterium]MYJ26823.1 NAD(+) diphosphatase [Holophagales bacterium]